jgi:hypothetical protein
MTTGRAAPFRIQTTGRTHTYEDFQCDARLYTFTDKLAELAVPIPDAVINNILAQAGFYTTEITVSRIFNLMAYKFICDVVHEGMLQNEKNEVQVESVKAPLARRGIFVHRPPFLVGEAAVADTSEQNPFEDNGQAMNEWAMDESRGRSPA